MAESCYQPSQYFWYSPVGGWGGGGGMVCFSIEKISPIYHLISTLYLSVLCKQTQLGGTIKLFRWMKCWFFFWLIIVMKYEILYQYVNWLYNKTIVDYWVIKYQWLNTPPCAFCIHDVWPWLLLPQSSTEMTNHRMQILTRLKPRSILVFSGGCHVISSTSIVNNCIILFEQLNILFAQDYILSARDNIFFAKDNNLLG